MAGQKYEPVAQQDLDIHSILWPIILGFPMGFFVAKSCIMFPTVLLSQWNFSAFLVLKVWLSSLIVSLASSIVMSILNETTSTKFRGSRALGTHGIVSVVLGAAVSGIGLAISGSGAAMPFMQFGFGMHKAAYVILGGCLAVLTFGLLYQLVFSKLDNISQSLNHGTLDELFNCSFFAIALPFTALLCGCLFLAIKKTSGWESELPSGASAASTNDGVMKMLTGDSWNPYLAGAALGFFQAIMRATIGCSVDSVYAYISPVVLPMKAIYGFFKAEDKMPSWFKSHSATSGLWAFICCISAGVGAFVVATMAGSKSVPFDIEVQWLILGGFLIVCGALIAGACPVGLAFSGCADLNISAIFGTCVFVGVAKLTLCLIDKK